MAKIWQKNNTEPSTASKLFNKFTTGNDWQIDRDYFLGHDALASIAHATALEKIGVYTKEELAQLRIHLTIVYNNPSVIDTNQDFEDSHSAIEDYLIKELGDVGKKIHIGRSRNDQSLTMIRLYMRAELNDITRLANRLSNDFNNLSKDNRNQVFIGYSHTQQAMITTLGHYYNSFKEQLDDDIELLKYTYRHINKNPLGSGAGFGSAVELDRHLTSELMGFDSVQNNSLYCQNSRGKFELLYLHAVNQVMQTLQRFAVDMILYTTREFALFNVSDELSQGSSMMPQKKNLDVFEIIRAKSAETLSLENRVQLILKGLPSGYNRDLQLIKNALVESGNIVKDCLEVVSEALIYIKPNIDNINSAIKKDIFSADIATIKCLENPELTFRDVYQTILNQDIDISITDTLTYRKSSGGPVNY